MSASGRSEIHIVTSGGARQRLAHIHATVRERIALLHYPPGARLDLDALAAEFGVSRTPIRSALQRLEHEGLVETRHGVGTRVTAIAFDDVCEIAAFRMRLAELIGDLSPLAPSPAVLGRLRAARDACAGLLCRVDPEGFGRVDLEVHECVCALIGHPQLRQVYDALYYRTARIWTVLLPTLPWETEVSIFLADIELTLQAMERGDVRGVGFLTRNALAAMLYRLSGHLERSGGRPA